MSIRCFIAIELDEAVRKELGRLQDRLRRRFDVLDTSVNWVRPENIHLTLKFLGDVQDNVIADICSAVSMAVVGTVPFDFEFANCGCFPPSGSARVLWTGITDGSKELQSLQTALENHLGMLGFPPEGRKFTPHLTLARIKNAKIGRTVQDAVKDIEPFVLARQNVWALTVFQSELTRTGPVYTALHHAKLDQ